MSGVTFATPGLPALIVLNSDQPADRLRFTLAHELGHLVMHRFPVAGDGRGGERFRVGLADARKRYSGAFLGAAASIWPSWRPSSPSGRSRCKRY